MAYDTFTFEIVAHLGVISERTDYNGNKWAKEVNLVSWNGRPAVIDIREWNSDHTQMKHGITLNDSEADKAIDLLIDYRDRRYL